MGEKPTEQDETAARESPTRASQGREAGSGMATGRSAVVDESPPSIAIGDPGVNSGIAIDEEGVQRATNLNTSRSNAYRAVSPGGQPDPTPAEASTVKSSKSNSSERLSGPGGETDPTPAEATNLNSSKSNIYRETEPARADDDPPATARPS